MRQTVRSAFPYRSTDRLGRFGLDQFLDPELGELTNQISSTALVDDGKYFVDGRLRQSHRRGLLGVQFGSYTPSLTPVAHLTVDPLRNPTTPRDSYLRTAVTRFRHPRVS